MHNFPQFLEFWCRGCSIRFDVGNKTWHNLVKLLCFASVSSVNQLHHTRETSSNLLLLALPILLQW